MCRDKETLAEMQEIMKDRSDVEVILQESPYIWRKIEEDMTELQEIERIPKEDLLRHTHRTWRCPSNRDAYERRLQDGGF